MLKRSRKLKEKKKLRALDYYAESFENTRSVLGIVLEKFNKELKNGMKLAQSSRYTADAINSFVTSLGSEEEQGMLNTHLLSKWMLKLGIVAKKTADLRTSCNQQLQSQIITSIDNLINKDLVEAKASHKQYNKSIAQFQQAKTKLEQTKQKKQQSKISELETELEALTKIRDTLASSTVNKFRECTALESFTLVEDIFAYFKSMATYFVDGNALMQKYLPQVEEASQQLSQLKQKCEAEREKCALNVDNVIKESMMEDAELFVDIEGAATMDSLGSVSLTIPTFSKDEDLQLTAAATRGRSGSVASNPKERVPIMTVPEKKKSSEKNGSGVSSSPPLSLSSSGSQAPASPSPSSPISKKPNRISLKSSDSSELSPHEAENPDEERKQSFLSPRQKLIRRWNERNNKKESSLGKPKKIDGEEISSFQMLLDKMARKHDRFHYSYAQLQKIQDSAKKVPTEDGSVFFCNLKEIAAANADRLNKLQLLQRKSDTKQTQLEIFLQVIPKLKLHLDYMENFPKSLALYDNYYNAKTLPAICLSDSSSSSSDGENPDFRSLLATPIKEASFILQSIDAHSRFCSPEDQQQIDVNQDFLHTVLQRVEFTNKLLEHITSVRKILDKIQNVDMPISESSSRRFIVEGRLISLVEVDGEEPISKFTGKIFVFSDIILVTKPMKLAEKKYKLIRILQLHRSSLLDTSDSESEKFCFTVQETESRDTLHRVTFFAKNSEDKNEWVTAIQSTISQLDHQKVFGISLAQLMSTDRERNRLIPSFVSTAVESLIKIRGIQAEGIFRVSGSTGAIEKFRDSANRGEDYTKSFSNLDHHSIAGLLKLFLRQLNPPIIPLPIHEELTAAIKIDDDRERTVRIGQVLRKMPQLNKFTLQFVMKFFTLVASYSETNKMTATNIAIVIGPVLMPNQASDPFDTTGQHISIQFVKSMIEQYNEIFFSIEEERRTLESLNASLGISPSPKMIIPEAPPLPPSFHLLISSISQSSHLTKIICVDQPDKDTNEGGNHSGSSSSSSSSSDSNVPSLTRENSEELDASDAISHAENQTASSLS